MTSTREATVVVTGIGGGGHGEQILKALRLGALRYRIIGTDIRADSAGRAIVDAFHRVPPARDVDYIDHILGLAERYRASAVFHGSEPEMRAMSEASARFRDAGVYLPVNPPNVLDICQNKIRSVEFLAARGFRMPRSHEVKRLEDLDDFDLLPTVLKPSIGGGGSANVFIAQSAAELRAFAAYLLTIYPQFVVQEYVGTAAQEYTVGVLFGADGTFLNSIAVKRSIGTALTVRTSVPNRTGRDELGPNLIVSSGISQGTVGTWPAVTRPCEEIAATLGPCAPVNIQCRLVDGDVVPFEINPRFSGTTSLRAMAGYNEPDVLIRREVLGEEIEPRFAYDSCVIVRGLSEQRIEDELAGSGTDEVGP